MSKPPNTFRDMVITLLKSSGEHHRPPPMPLGYRRNRHHFKAIFPEPDHIDLNVAIEPPAQNHHHHIDMNQAPKKPYHHHQHHNNYDQMHQDPKNPYQNHQHLYNIDHMQHRDPKKPYHNHQHHNIDMHQDHKKPYQNHQNHIDMHQDPKEPYRNHDMHQDPKKPRQKHQQHVKDPKKPYQKHHQWQQDDEDPKKPYQMNVNLDVNVNYLDVKKEPYSRSSSSGSHRHLVSACAYCLWALLFLLLTATFLAVTGAILYFWLQPRAPDFRVVHVNMTDVRLESWNRNDALGFAYGPVRVGVYSPGKEGVLLSAPGFALAPNSVTVVEARAEAEAAAVPPEERMVVEVRAECHVAVDVGGSDAGVYPIKVVCAGLEVGMVESESESGCDVYLYGWMLIRGHKRK